jgi:hypothetical protein
MTLSITELSMEHVFVAMLSVIMLNVIMLNVVAPRSDALQHSFFPSYFPHRVYFQNCPARGNYCKLFYSRNLRPADFTIKLFTSVINLLLSVTFPIV